MVGKDEVETAAGLLSREGVEAIATGWFNFNRATANQESEKERPVQSLCHGLLWRQRADKVDKVPAIGIGKCGLEGRHARAGEAIRDPFEKLGIGVNARDGMESQVRRARIERHANGSIPFIARSMTASAGRHEYPLTCCDRFLVWGDWIGLFVEHLNWARQEKDANSDHQDCDGESGSKTQARIYLQRACQQSSQEPAQENC